MSQADARAGGAKVRPTALLIDKSGSMHEAIEVGLRLGPLIARASPAGLYAYAFDVIPYPIEGVNGNPATWEKALAGMTPGGSTSCGVAIEMMRRRRQRVEQLVMVTDEDENTEPFFLEALRGYAREMELLPRVLFVKTRGAGTRLEAQCLRSKIAVQTYQFTGSFHDLPELLPMLVRPGRPAHPPVVPRTGR